MHAGSQYICSSLIHTMQLVLQIFWPLLLNLPARAFPDVPLRWLTPHALAVWDILGKLVPRQLTIEAAVRIYIAHIGQPLKDCL